MQVVPQQFVRTFVYPIQCDCKRIDGVTCQLLHEGFVVPESLNIVPELLSYHVHVGGCIVLSCAKLYKVARGKLEVFRMCISRDCAIFDAVNKRSFEKLFQHK